jgi:hypothetical protein
MDYDERLAQCNVDIKALNNTKDALIAEKRADEEAKKDPLYEVRKYVCEYVNNTFPLNPTVIDTSGTLHYVKISLPHANDRWTFAAFHWVEKFCEHFNRRGLYVYPIHDASFDNREALYIKI